MKHKLKATIEIWHQSEDCKLYAKTCYEYTASGYSNMYDKYSVAEFEEKKAISHFKEWCIDSGFSGVFDLSMYEDDCTFKIEPVKES